jgi:hypothetical protein
MKKNGLDKRFNFEGEAYFQVKKGQTFSVTQLML